MLTLYDNKERIIINYDVGQKFSFIDNKMKWDGSSIGKIDYENILLYFKHDGSDYYLLQMDTDFLNRENPKKVKSGIFRKPQVNIIRPRNRRIKITYKVIEVEDEKEEFNEDTCYLLFVEYRNMTSLLQCFVDELKPFFNVRKIGTRWMKNGSKICLLHKPKWKEYGSRIYLGKTLSSCIDIDRDLIKKEIIDILAFKEIVGVRSSNEGTILTYFTDENEVEVTSIKECSLRLDDSQVISANIKDKWMGFTKERLEMIMIESLGILDFESLLVISYRLRNKMDNAMKRVLKGTKFQPWSKIKYAPDVISKRLSDLAISSMR